MRGEIRRPGCYRLQEGNQVNYIIVLLVQLYEKTYYFFSSNRREDRTYPQTAKLKTQRISQNIVEANITTCFMNKQ